MVKLANGSVVLRRPSPTAQTDNLIARAVSLARDGRRQEAIPLFQQILKNQPDEARAHYNLGVALAEEKKFEESLSCFQAAVRYQPGSAEAHHGMGNVLGELGRDEEAIVAYRKAIKYQPDHAGTLHNLGVALTRLRRSGEAAVFLHQAVRLRPDFAEALNSLGLTYLQHGDFAVAETNFMHALQLNPRCVAAHTNLGSTYKEQGRLEEAVACYDLALAMDPECTITHWNRSLAWLQMGDFQQGWPEYEWRWRRKTTPPPPYTQPRWDGSPLGGRTILLHAEQGLGDMMQFVRYVPSVKEKGGVVIIAAPSSVIGLLATCSGIDQTVTDGQTMPTFDVHAPLLSLPGLLKTDVATIPAKVPYLTADSAKLDRWGHRLRAIPGFKVGISWQGNPRHDWDAHRSFPLAAMEPMARVDGVTLISLQKGSATDQIALVKDRFPVFDLGRDLTDFTETAAVIKQLDLVICCDTSVGHLAGALAVPVWLALSTFVDWRWLRGTNSSPWYPTMRLFRQERLGKWKSLLRRIAKELKRFCDSPKNQNPT